MLCVWLFIVLERTEVVAIKKLIILFLLIVLATSVLADYEKVIVSDINCKGNIRARMYGSNSCYFKGCSLAGDVWYCPCSSSTTLTMAAVNRDTCKATIEYYLQDNKRILFPVTITWPEPVENETEQPAFKFPVISSVVLFVGGAAVVIVIIIIVIKSIIRYIKKEIEEDEMRNQ